MTGGWNWMVFTVLSNPNRPVTLWRAEALMLKQFLHLKVPSRVLTDHICSVPVVSLSSQQGGSRGTVFGSTETRGLKQGLVGIIKAAGGSWWFLSGWKKERTNVGSEELVFSEKN